MASFPSLPVLPFYQRFINCHPLCVIPLWRFFQPPTLLLFIFSLTVPSLCCVPFLTTNRPLASLYLLCQCDTVCHHSNLLQTTHHHLTLPPQEDNYFFIFPTEPTDRPTARCRQSALSRCRTGTIWNVNVNESNSRIPSAVFKLVVLSLYTFDKCTAACKTTTASLSVTLLCFRVLWTDFPALVPFFFPST